MTGCEDDLGSTALDAHIRTQLAKAAETCASHANLDARLKTILEAGTDSDQDVTAAGQD